MTIALWIAVYLAGVAATAYAVGRAGMIECVALTFLWPAMFVIALICAPLIALGRLGEYHRGRS